MARLSISEAARQAGVTRQHLHRLIKAGKATASTDEMGNRYIDDTELLRAFDGRIPKVKPLSLKDTEPPHVTLHEITPLNDGQITALQVEVQLLREQLAAAKERDQEVVQLLREQLQKSEEREQEYKQREARLQSTVDKLTDTIRQIEYRPEPAPPDEYTSLPDPQLAPPRRGFWARVFRRGQT